MSKPTVNRHVAGIGLVVLLLAPPAGAAQRFDVDLGDYAFEPAVVEVTAGEPVELALRNRDIFILHNLKLSAGGIDLDVDVPPGDTVTVSFTPTRAGRYVFYCDKKLLFFKSHRERGMEGELIVKAP